MLANYDIISAIKSDPKYKQYNAYYSMNWFTTNIKKALGGQQMGALNVLGMMKDHQTSIIMPGGLYMFTYSPKTKEKLPYYDRFPLVFPFNTYPDGFIGLNLHYLPPAYRAKLFNSLISIKGDKKTKMRVSWQILSSVARTKGINVCVKRYLSGHVKSRFINVPEDDWKVAIFLPTESFAKQNKNAVWQESISKL